MFRWTYPGDPVRHLRAAELLSGQTFTKVDGAEALSHVLKELMADIGMPSSLSDFGYGPATRRRWSQGPCSRRVNSRWCPAPFTAEALAGIYRASF